jgi:para-nitrobenzyl esterase
MRFASALLLAASAYAANTVHIDSGVIEGVTSSDSAIRMFKGIPYAAPPVGELRWKAPQPAPAWTGVRKADAFGGTCMQGRVFGDMNFRDKGLSEDCLYLNVWTPAKTAGARLPVMFWVYGGGFVAGSSSEPRQDGEILAHKGVVVVSFNYRLGLFGFYAHPDLAKESGHNSAGNYGLLDQVAALQWVHKNIAAFGGDPRNVTIFGESAGSFSVCALMASPLSRDLIHGAIGESGAFFGSTLQLKSREEAAAAATKFAESQGATSLAAMRAKPADELLKAAMKDPFGFGTIIDGYFLSKSAAAIFAEGSQAHVPLLAGWNENEGGTPAATVQSFTARVQAMFPDAADELLKAYPAATDEQAKQSASDLASDQFIGYSTWKWIEAHLATGKSPVYRYRFDQAPPQASGPSRGAYHSAEIEFVFDQLASKDLPWRDEDKKLSDQMSSYWANFAKKKDPNGTGLTEWPSYKSQNGRIVLHLSSNIHAAPEEGRARYEFLDTHVARPVPPQGRGGN